MKLNIGCGNKSLKGYHNIDTRKLKGVDEVADIRDLTFFKEDIKEILAVDVIEHIPQKEVQKLLTKFYAWLIPGGVLRMRLPDMLAVSKSIVNGELVPNAIQRIYGGQQYDDNFHKSGFTQKMMVNILMNIGFLQLEVKPSGWNFTIRGVK